MSETISATRYVNGEQKFEFKHKFEKQDNHDVIYNLDAPDGSIDHIQNLALDQVEKLLTFVLDGKTIPGVPMVEIISEA